jgi:hypothetical protein
LIIMLHFYVAVSVKPERIARVFDCELGLVLWKGKLMLFYQLVRRFHEIYAPSNFHRMPPQTMYYALGKLRQQGKHNIAVYLLGR